MWGRGEVFAHTCVQGGGTDQLGPDWLMRRLGLPRPQSQPCTHFESCSCVLSTCRWVGFVLTSSAFTAWDAGNPARFWGCTAADHPWRVMR
jgi:hypothetical protein